MLIYIESAVLFTEEVQKGCQDRREADGIYSKLSHSIFDENGYKANAFPEFPRSKGKNGAYDITAYHPAQQKWGPAQSDWPDILFDLDKPTKPADDGVTPPHPGFIYYRGDLVLVKETISFKQKEKGTSNKKSVKINYRPVLDWVEIPLTLSSQEPGYSLETMCRSNDQISHQDLIDRMPPNSGVDTLIITKRRSQFRRTNNLLSWSQRGTAAGKAALKYFSSLLPPELLEANTTRGFRALTQAEKDHLANLYQDGSSRGSRKRPRDEEVEDALEGPQTGASTTDFSPNSATLPTQANIGGPSSESINPTAEVLTTGSSSDQSPSQQHEPATQTSHPDEGRGPTEKKIAEVIELASYTGDVVAMEVDPPQNESFDYRDAKPNTREESMVIGNALMNTRYQLCRMTTSRLPHTNHHSSYNEQWAELYGYLKAAWMANGKLEASLPMLVKQERWPGGYPWHLLERHVTNLAYREKVLQGR